MLCRLRLVKYPVDELIGIYNGVSGKSAGGFVGFDRIPLNSCILLRCGDGSSGCFVNVNAPLVVLEWTGQGFCETHPSQEDDSQVFVHADFENEFAFFPLDVLNKYGIKLNQVLLTGADFPIQFSLHEHSMHWPSIFQLSFTYFHCFASSSGFDVWCSVIKALEYAPSYLLSLRIANLLAHYINILQHEGLLEEMPRLQHIASHLLLSLDDDEEVSDSLRSTAEKAWPGFTQEEEEEFTPTIVADNVAQRSYSPPPTFATTKRMDWML